MKRSIAIVLGIALVLSGCKTTSQADPYAPLALSPGKGAVVFTIDRHGRSLVRPFAIHGVRYDPRSGKVLSSSGDDGQGFKAVYSTKPEIGRDSKHWAFELEPGDYAIASVDRVGVAQQPVFTGGSLAVLLIATVIATAASHAVAAAEHESHEFVRDGYVGPQTPRFTITAGRVTHIGDFSFGSESREAERTVPINTWGGPNAVGMDHSKLERVTDYRTVVYYSFEPDAVSGYLKLRRLDRRPIDHQRLEALHDRPFVLEDFPGESEENRSPLRTATAMDSLLSTSTTHPQTNPTPGPITTVVASPAADRGAASGGIGASDRAGANPAMVPAKAAAPPDPWVRPAAQPASVVPTFRPRRPAGLDELMQRFLDGKISKAEYDRGRAELATGS